MNNKEQLLLGLQAIVTGLEAQAHGHVIQSKIFADQGFGKLATKYAEHATEERGYVEKIMERILDLGGELKNEGRDSIPVCLDPIEWIKYDLQVSVNGLAYLASIIELAKNDLTTFDLLKNYYKDEEEDMYWGETQLNLVEKVGIQNYLVTLM